jgi:site-specific recombinase XerD
MTSKSIVTSGTSALSRPIETTAEDVARLRRLAKNRRAANTRRAYAADWEHFRAWCLSRGGDPEQATPENVAVYLAQLPDDGYRYASIARASAGIMSELAKYDQGRWLSRPPEVQKVLKDLARALGRTPQGAKKALTFAIIERGLRRAYPGDSMRELRNAAMILLGYFLAARRSELAPLAFQHVDTSNAVRGINVTIEHSKTDQEAEGMQKFIYRQADDALCPVRALGAWVAAAGLVHDGRAAGPIFRRLSYTKAGENVLELPVSDEAVSEAVKEVAKGAGLDPDDFGGHSLRAGFITDCAEQGVSLEQIAHQTGHKSLEQLRRYIRRMHPSQGNPTEGFAARARLVRR